MVKENAPVQRCWPTLPTHEQGCFSHVFNAYGKKFSVHVKIVKSQEMHSFRLMKQNPPPRWRAVSTTPFLHYCCSKYVERVAGLKMCRDLLRQGRRVNPKSLYIYIHRNITSPYIKSLRIHNYLSSHCTLKNTRIFHNGRSLLTFQMNLTFTSLKGALIHMDSIRNCKNENCTSSLQASSNSQNEYIVKAKSLALLGISSIDICG